MNTSTGIALHTIDATYLGTSGFPFRFQITPEQFMAWTMGVTDPMVMFELCWGFVAWLEWNEPTMTRRVDPRMAAGTLFGALRLIERVLRDPSLLEEDDLSGRNGTVVQFGVAGLDHEWHKMCRGLEALRVSSLEEAEKLEEAAGVAEMAAEHSARNGNGADAVVFAEHAIALRANAEIKRALAAQLLEELIENDVAALVARYRAAGSFGNEETVISVSAGSLGGAEYDADGNVRETEGVEYRVAETLENFETMADNSALRAKVRAVRRRRA